LKPPFDITEVLRAAGREPAGREGREALYFCPFHPDKSPSLRVNVEKGVYFCPVCAAQDPRGAGGGLTDLATRLRVNLSRLAGSRYFIPDPPPPVRRDAGKLVDFARVWSELYVREPVGMEYLRGRHLHQAADLGLVRFATNKGARETAAFSRQGFRVVAPLIDATGRICALSLRRVTATQPRFHAIGQVKATLYGKVGFNITDDITTVVLTEGWGDWATLSLHCAPTTVVLGIHSAATFDADSLLAFPGIRSRRIYFLGHADDAGRGLADRVVGSLSSLSPVVLFPPVTTDWNEELIRVGGDDRRFKGLLAEAHAAAARRLP